MGNPWIFREIEHYLETGEHLEKPDPAEKIEAALRQVRHTVELFGKEYAANTMKKHIAWYLKGIPDSTRVKTAVFGAHDCDTIYDILTTFLTFQRTRQPAWPAV